MFPFGTFFVLVSLFLFCYVCFIVFSDNRVTRLYAGRGIVNLKGVIMNGDFNTYFVRSADDYIELPLEESGSFDSSVSSYGSSESVPVVEEVQTSPEDSQENVVIDYTYSVDLITQTTVSINEELHNIRSDLSTINQSIMLVLFALLFTFVWRVFRK